MQPGPSIQTNQSTAQSSTDWSNASPGMADSGWKRGSTPYNSPAAPRPPMSSHESTSSRQSPQQVYNPTSPSSLGFQQHDSPIGSVPTSAIQPTFPLLQSSIWSGFPTVSNMMFPSNDPFAYPNQPMISMENYQNVQNQPFDTQSFPNSTNGESYGGFNASFFGPLPSYPMLGTRRSSNLGDNHADGQPIGIDGIPGPPQESQQGRFGGPLPESNWDAMFGEDWSGGWADQGYGQ